MLSPNLARYVEDTADEIRKEYPYEVAHLSDLELQVAVLDKVRAIASEKADTMIGIVKLTQVLEDLAELVQHS